MIPMLRSGVLVLLLLAVLAAACSGSDESDGDATSSTPASTTTAAPSTTAAPTSTTQAPATTTAPPPVPDDIEGEPIDGGVDSWLAPHLAVDTGCPEPSPDDPVATSCYRLTVAADRDDPGGGVVVLPLQVTSPTGIDVPADAVVSPAGGPGFAGIGRASGLAVTLGRDIVGFDQRGTGGASPWLECRGADDMFLENLQRAETFEVERGAVVEATEACIAEAAERGIDLTDYNSIESVHDLEDIRVALGYEQWNLVGVSYGGRFALVSMREHPDSIRSVILDSVYDVTYGGPSSTFDSIGRAFDALIEACAASAPCAARGDLGEMLDRVVERYNATPIESTVPVDGQPVDFVITGDDVVAGLFQAMYDTGLLPILPSIVSSLDRGETAIVADFIASSVPFATDAATLMAFATDCSDNVGLGRVAADRAVLADPGRLSTVAKQQMLCPDDWTPTAAGFNEPIVSDLPALIYAGGLDPITPPGPTLALAENLANATSVFVPFGGHGVWLVDDCAAAISFAFIEDPTITPDTTCAADYPELAPA